MSRRRAFLAVALALTGVGVVALTVGPWRENVEHVVHPETAPLRVPDGEYVQSVPGGQAELWAVGDAGAGSDARAAAALIARSNFDRLLYLGDVYPDGSAGAFDAWGEVWGELAERTAPTPGNHDWPDATEGYDPYWKSVYGAPPPTFYAFRAGGWDLVSVNSEARGDDEAGPAQERWLRERFATHPGDCRVVFWHRPRFSAGPHGDDGSVDALWRMLPGHARLLLSGHEHNMQRLNAEQGVVSFIAGAGGESHTTPSVDDQRLAFGDGRHVGALRISLRPGRMRWAFVDVGGRRLNTGSLACGRLRRN